MRQSLLVGNWKMNKTSAEARAFAEALGRQASDLSSDCDYAICAPYTSLHVLRVMLPVQVVLGAQNVYPESSGPYTGEVSMHMLQEFGTRYVIVGHSERRTRLGETDAFIAAKVQAVVQAGSTPILCVGEDEAEKALGHTESVVAAQVTRAFADTAAGDVARCVVAYEPIWAIGSGASSAPADAQRVIRLIRDTIALRFDQAVAEQVRILYGGSVKPGNIAAFVAEPDIDGALVGGASLDADSFVQLAIAMAEGVVR